MDTSYPCGLVWLRRDLRVHDNAALYHALKHCRQVHVAFVFDTAILDGLPRADRRVEFIRESLVALDQRLAELGGEGCGLIVRHGVAEQEIPQLARQLGALAVFASHDDEPYALQRDARVRGQLAALGTALHTCKDHVVFERQEVMTQSGTAFSVFTPYKNAWLRKVNDHDLQAYPVERHAQQLAPRPESLRLPVPRLADMGFAPTNLQDLHIAAGEAGAQALLAEFLQRIDAYGQRRDFPAVKGPSYLSVHLRFGTVSVRQLAREAHARMLAGSEGAGVWLSELIWRDFYAQVLANFAHVGAGESFKRDYDAIAWAHGTQAKQLLDAWCAGRTGYPLVDAAMRQLLQTGTCTTACAWWWPAFCARTWAWTGVGVKNTLPPTSMTSTWPPTMAAGNGPAPVAATRSPTSASSTLSARAKNSTPKASSSAAMSPNSPDSRPRPSTPPGWLARSNCNRQAWCWARPTPAPSSTTPKPEKKPWRATQWSKRKPPKRGG